MSFQSTYLYKVRLVNVGSWRPLFLFQSTYLYKVRLCGTINPVYAHLFQSTYLYKVRHHLLYSPIRSICFNPRTYIRYDPISNCTGVSKEFQSTYLYKVRQKPLKPTMQPKRFQSTYLYKVRHNISCDPAIRVSFNPRTYIRYDWTGSPIN